MYRSGLSGDEMVLLEASWVGSKYGKVKTIQRKNK